MFGIMTAELQNRRYRFVERCCRTGLPQVPHNRLASVPPRGFGLAAADATHAVAEVGRGLKLSTRPVWGSPCTERLFR